MKRFLELAVLALMANGIVALVAVSMSILLHACQLPESSKKAVYASAWNPFSGGSAQVVNPWQLQAAYFFDPSNVSGCASDKNKTCSLSTCGTSGDGPCSTWAEYIARAATMSGILPQNTTVTMMSAQQNPNDPIVWPVIMQTIGATDANTATSGPTILFQCTTTSVTAGTTALVTAKNRATNTRFRYNITTPAPTYGQLLQNTTRGSSLAWGGLPQTELSQPLNPTVLNTNGQAPTPGAENDTWASNDTVNILTLPKVWIRSVLPTSTGLSGQATMIIQHCFITESPEANVLPGDDQILANGYVYFIEDAIDPMLMASGASTPTQQGGVFNCSIAGGGQFSFTGNSATLSGGANVPYPILAGILSSNSLNGGTGSITISGNVLLDDDVVLRGVTNVPTLTGVNYGGLIENETHTTMVGGIFDERTFSNSGSHVIWGNNAGAPFDVGRGLLMYPAVDGGAVATFPLAGGLQLQGGTTCALLQPNGVIVTAQTLSTTNLDLNFGGFDSGCFGVLNVASVCNTGY